MNATARPESAVLAGSRNCPPVTRCITSSRPGGRRSSSSTAADPAPTGTANSAEHRADRRAGYRVLVPDMIGFGWSSKPDIDYPLDLFVTTCSEFLDQMGVKRCTLVGNSLGGAISIQALLDRPSLVEKLVMMGTGGIESRETYFAMPGIRAMVSQFVGAGFDQAGAARAARDARLRSQGGRRRAARGALERAADAAESRTRADADSGPLAAPDRHPLPGARVLGVEDHFCPVSGANKILAAVGDSHGPARALRSLGDARIPGCLQQVCRRLSPELTAPRGRTSCDARRRALRGAARAFRGAAAVGTRARARRRRCLSGSLKLLELRLADGER